MSLSSRPITNYHRGDGLSIIILTCFSEFWKLEVQDQGTSRFRVWFVDSLFSHGKSVEGAPWGLLCKGTNPIMWDTPSLHHHLPKVLPPNRITLGVRFQHMNWEKTEHTDYSKLNPDNFQKLRIKRMCKKSFYIFLKIYFCATNKCHKIIGGKKSVLLFFFFFISRRHKYLLLSYCFLCGQDEESEEHNHIPGESHDF